MRMALRRFPVLIVPSSFAILLATKGISFGAEPNENFMIRRAQFCDGQNRQRRPSVA